MTAAATKPLAVIAASVDNLRIREKRIHSSLDASLTHLRRPRFDSARSYGGD
jgi:hypothetical protein